MDDDAAFMALVLSNSQGELDPLEIGIHAFEAVPLSKGGRGKKGGLSEYAEKIGKQAPHVTNYRNAGEVIKAVAISCPDIRTSLLGKAYHLSAIHKLPREVWQTMAHWIVGRLAQQHGVSARTIEVTGSFRG